MKITIIPKGNRFNIGIAAKEGSDPFLEIAGCMLREGKNGPWLALPASKSPTDGKWYKHVFATDEFVTYVMELAKDMPVIKAKQFEPKISDRSAKNHMKAIAPHEDDVPF